MMLVQLQLHEYWLFYTVCPTKADNNLAAALIPSEQAHLKAHTRVCVPCPQQKLLMCVPGSQQLPSPGDFTDFPTRAIA